VKVHPDGSLDIEYDDGDFEEKVDTSLVRFEIEAGNGENEHPREVGKAGSIAGNSIKDDSIMEDSFPLEESLDSEESGKSTPSTQKLEDYDYVEEAQPASASSTTRSKFHDTFFDYMEIAEEANNDAAANDFAAVRIQSQVRKKRAMSDYKKALTKKAEERVALEQQQNKTRLESISAIKIQAHIRKRRARLVFNVRVETSAATKIQARARSRLARLNLPCKTRIKTFNSQTFDHTEMALPSEVAKTCVASFDPATFDYIEEAAPPGEMHEDTGRPDFEGSETLSRSDSVPKNLKPDVYGPGHLYDLSNLDHIENAWPPDNASRELSSDYKSSASLLSGMDGGGNDRSVEDGDIYEDFDVVVDLDAVRGELLDAKGELPTSTQTQSRSAENKEGDDDPFPPSTFSLKWYEKIEGDIHSKEGQRSIARAISKPNIRKKPFLF